MVQTLAANRADHALPVGSLPRRPGSRQHLFDLQIGGPVQILGGGGDNPVQDELGNTNYQSVYVGQNVISGPVTENGYAGAGDDGNGSFVGFDHTSGPMTLINNTVASILVQSNVINGPATCSGNNPLPQDLGSSTVTGPLVN